MNSKHYKGADDLHPLVRKWVVQNQREQAERKRDYEQERKKSKNPWSWWTALLDDLTERDLYRFEQTSLIFRALEKVGVKIKDAPITGKATLIATGHEIECSIVEKMTKGIGRSGKDEVKWTAYPRDHNAAFRPTGFLRVTITTYVPGKRLEWIESDKRKISDLLSEIVGGFLTAGATLADWKRTREEEERRRHEEEARRREQQRLQEIDSRRWVQFKAQADNWQKHDQLGSGLVD